MVRVSIQWVEKVSHAKVHHWSSDAWNGCNVVLLEKILQLIEIPAII